MTKREHGESEVPQISSRRELSVLPQVLGRLGGAMTLLALCACSAGSPDRAVESGPPATATRRESPAEVAGGAALRVTLYGIGSVRAGMSVAEASAALGSPLELPTGAGSAESCSYLRWPGGPDGVLIMAEHLTIARVDVRSGTMATEEGARFGDTTERIDRLYPGRVTASPHKYTDGQYLTIAPASPEDAAFRLVFETAAGRVTRYRSGRLPQVQYVEGCS
jgi:hypothetical protein